MTATDIAQIATVVIGVGSISISGILWNVVQAYKLRTEQLEEEINDHRQSVQNCKAQHNENEKKITVLQGQIKTYEGLALVPLDFIKNQQKTQKEIIRVLRQIEINQPNNADRDRKDRS